MRVLERVVDAWRSTPTKWYPHPWFVGACLLVFLQYRRNSKANKEVDVREDGEVPVDVEELRTKFLDELVPRQFDEGLLVDAPPVLDESVLKPGGDMGDSIGSCKVSGV